jgi:hypothetical protein
MKLIAALALAIAIVAGSATGLAFVLPSHGERAAAGEPCFGLGCWPSMPSIKHRPSYRPNLQPVL